MRIINFVAIQWPWYELFNLFPIPFRFVLLLAKWSEVAQSCPTLCDPVDCSPPCSSVHGIFQARVLEWVAIFFSRGSSLPRDRTQVSRIVSKMLYRLSHQGSPKEMIWLFIFRKLRSKVHKVLGKKGLMVISTVFEIHC